MGDLILIHDIKQNHADVWLLSEMKGDVIHVKENLKKNSKEHLLAMK